MDLVSTKNLNPALVRLFMSWRPKWLIWDAWLTLWISHCREPIGLLQWEFDKSLTIGPHYHPVPTKPFLNWCLTNPNADTEAYLLEAGREFGWNITSQNMETFRKIVDVESGCASLMIDAEPTLREAHALGFTEQGIISNLWPFPANRLFDPNGLIGQFIPRERVLCSFELQRAKPDEAVFMEFCRRFNVRPEDCLMIGDNLSADVEGALKVGMKAMLIDRLRNVNGEQLMQVERRVSEFRGEPCPPILYTRDLTELLDYLRLCPKP